MYIAKQLGLIKKTPLHLSERLSNIYKCNVFLKREDLQITRSFKIRGVFNKIYNTKNKNSSFITVSAGNHAQGLAHICDFMDNKCVIFVPENTPKQKINAIKKYKSVDIKIIGNSFDDTIIHCNKYIIKNNNLEFIHPFDDNHIISGQGTILGEICEEINPDFVYSPIGGGGLMAGLINNNNNNNIKFIGAEPEGASSMYNNIYNIINNKHMCNFVDGASVKNVGNITSNIIKKHIYNIFKINNKELCYDLVQLYQNDGIIAELAGALSISALRHTDLQQIRGKNIVCIISGGNNDINRLGDFINKNNEYLLNQKFAGNV